MRPPNVVAGGRWSLSPHDRVFALSLGGLIVLAWIALFVWGLSPYGSFLSHEGLGDGAITDGYVVLLFVAGWVLMTVAMMLPTSWPLLMLFNTMTRRRPDHRRLVALVIGGYLGVWTTFGFVAHSGDRLLHEFVESNAWLSTHEWLIPAGILLLAGVYQFMPLKYKCLEKCRSPFAFIAESWHGADAGKESWWLGVRHGLFCLGCCWSLMLLMFAVGVGNLMWMLLLAAIMAMEKNASWGRKLSAPVGIWLITSGMSAILFSAAPF